MLRDGNPGNVGTERIVLVLAISLLSALLAYSVLTSTALAQPSDDHVCPLSDEQAQKSVQAFDKIANVFTKEPRCVNCHGAVNPFAADAKETHGGGKFPIILKKKPNAARGETESTEDTVATFQQCEVCHDAFSGNWHIPPAALFFVGKDALTLCKLEKDVFPSSEAFIKHIEHDALIREGFTGRMALNGLGKSLIAVFAQKVKDDSVVTKYPTPPGVTRQDLIQMAHDWVDAQGGKFRDGPECGCKKHHYAIGIKETGVSDWVAGGWRSHDDISGEEDVPLTFKDDGSFSGEVTIPEKFTESLTTPSQVCSGKGSFSNQMNVTGNLSDDGQTMHLKFSWIWDGTISGTCTGTPPFNKSVSWSSADAKSPLTDGVDMPAKVGETREVPSVPPSNASQLTFTHTITIKQID